MRCLNTVKSPGAYLISETKERGLCKKSNDKSINDSFLGLLTPICEIIFAIVFVGSNFANQMNRFNAILVSNHTKINIIGSLVGVE